MTVPLTQQNSVGSTQNAELIWFDGELVPGSRGQGLGTDARLALRHERI